MFLEKRRVTIILLQWLYIFVNYLNDIDREEKLGKKDSPRFSIILEYEYGYNAWEFTSNDIEEVKKELKISILERPLYFEHSHVDYLKQMQVWAS